MKKDQKKRNMGILNSISDKLKEKGTYEAQKAAMKHKSLLPKKKGGEIPVDYFVAGLNNIDTMPQDGRRDDNYIHMSSLSGMCPREVTLRDKFGIKPPIQPVGKGVRVIWSLGRAAELHARHQLTEAYPEGCFGEWECKCREIKKVGVAKDTRKIRCPKCQGSLSNYREVTLFSEESKVSGNPDLLFISNGKVFTPIEFKSINQKGAEELIVSGKPKPDNALQVLGYRRILIENGFEVTEYAVVLYVKKEYKWGEDPYKEFRVYDKGGLKVALDGLFKTGKTVKTWRKHRKELPPRLPQCDKVESQRARKCQQCHLCFS